MSDADVCSSAVSQDSPDLLCPKVEIKSLNNNVLSKWRLIILALEVKVGRVRESVDTSVCPARDGQMDWVEWPQSP